MQFIPVSGVRHDIFFYEHPGLRNPIEIDATIKQQVRIRIVEHLNELPVLRIHCVVAALDSTHELVSAYLCRRVIYHFELLNLYNVEFTNVFILFVCFWLIRMYISCDFYPGLCTSCKPYVGC